ncbi:MAG: GFA family protein [Sphingomicrobium sp.]
MSAVTCRCGATQFQVEGGPLLTMACHCQGCQRMSASAFSLSSLYPADRFELLEGEPVIGGLKGATRHYFCPSCMTWLYTVPEGLEGFVNVRSSMIEGAEAHRPFVDMFRGEGFAWAQSGAERSFDAMPEEDEVPALLAAYAEWNGRVTQ